jgi:hypothetical protein
VIRRGDGKHRARQRHELHPTPPPSGVTLPPAVQQTVTLPAGTTLRLGKLPQCTASDAEIAAKGAESACPRGGVVRRGRLVLTVPTLAGASLPPSSTRRSPLATAGS